MSKASLRESYSFNSVRARIGNKSRETGIKADVLYRRYYLERFLSRAVTTEHRDSIIIKGGMLISAISGIDMRATKDLDATIRGKNLTTDDYRKIVDDVISVEIDDNVKFVLAGMEEIMLENRYSCCRAHLRALLGTMNGKIEIDFTSGDVITPKEIMFGFPTLLGDGKIPVLAYTIETVLAEKITAILDLGVFSSRAKDFYDVHLINALLADKIDKTIFKEALNNTLRQRGKEHLLVDCSDIARQITNSSDVQMQWSKYREEYPYAADIEFEQIVTAITEVLRWIGVVI